VLVEKGKSVEKGDQLNEGSLYPAEILALRNRTETEVYIVAEVQKVYRSQGVDINDKHIELIVRQMLKKVRVESKGSTELLPGQLEDRLIFDAINEKLKGKKTKTPARAEEVILGITKASLATESFLSAASFQETTKVLTDAALEGKRDRLMGLKENVIIGKLIPAATGLKHYRALQIEPVEPAQPPAEEFSEEELAKELDLAGDGDGGAAMEGFGPSFAGGARRARVGDRDAGRRAGRRAPVRRRGVRELLALGGRVLPPQGTVPSMRELRACLGPTYGATRPISCG
jgi:DNA-directed RNA polymerase subunit beta'